MRTIIESLGLFGGLFIVFLIILWTFLPFAVFGVKARLEEQTHLLKSIRDELRRTNSIGNESAPKEIENSAPKSTEYK